MYTRHPDGDDRWPNTFADELEKAGGSKVY
jgi:hypothetical protein